LEEKFMINCFKIKVSCITMVIFVKEINL